MATCSCSGNESHLVGCTTIIPDTIIHTSGNKASSRTQECRTPDLMRPHVSDCRAQVSRRSQSFRRCYLAQVYRLEYEQVLCPKQILGCKSCASVCKQRMAQSLVAGAAHQCWIARGCLYSLSRNFDMSTLQPETLSGIVTISHLSQSSLPTLKPILALSGIFGAAPLSAVS